MKHRFVKTSLKGGVKICSDCGCVIVPINSEAGKKALEERRARLLLYPKEKKKGVLR